MYINLSSFNIWLYNRLPANEIRIYSRNAVECSVLILKFFFIYIHGSVHHESNSITVKQDATYSVYYISVGSSTCFGCRNPSCVETHLQELVQL